MLCSYHSICKYQQNLPSVTYTKVLKVKLERGKHVLQYIWIAGIIERQRVYTLSENEPIKIWLEIPVVVLWEDKKSCSCQISDFSFKGNYKSLRKGTTSKIKAWEISRLSKNIKMFTVDKEWNNFSDGKSLLSLYHDLCHNWAVPQLQKSTLFTQYSVLLIVKSCSKLVKSMSTRMPDNFCQKTYIWKLSLNLQIKNFVKQL